MSEQERLNQALLEVAWGEEASKCEEIEDLILEKGADFTYQDKKGKTALHYAAEGGRGECVEILLMNGAGVTIHTKDNEGNTPFSLAKDLKRYHNDADVLKIFKAYEKEQKLQEKEAMMTNEEKEKRNKNEANMVARQTIAMRQVAEEREKERQKQLAKNRMEAEYRSERSHPPYSPGFQTLSEQQAAIAKGKWEAEHGGRRRVRKTRKSKKSRKSKKTRKH